MKLKEIDAETFNLDTLVEFFYSAAFPESKYADIDKDLLKQALLSSGNVTVLMDGFDEISPTYADKAAVILSELLKTTVGRVWVTSRPVEKERLEKELSIIAYGMKKLSRASQEGMLLTLWTPKAGEEELNTKLLAFIKHLLNELSDLFYEHNFTGCPLYTTMVATVYEMDVKACLSSTDWIEPRTNLVNLYEKFVERKLHIYLIEKQKADITNSSVLDNLEFLKQIYLMNFEKCALVAILPPQMLELLYNKKIEQEIQEFLDKVQARKDKTGIVMNVVEGKPQFVHRTFAEYFAARWFSKKFKSNRSVLEHILFDPVYSFVRDMFNRMLAKDCPLHCSALQGDIELFRTLLKGGCDVNAVDKGGRTVTHIIATLGSIFFDIRNLLSNNGIPLDTTDCVLQWAPLQYAIKSEDWVFVELLLENKVDRSGLDMIRQRSHDPDYIGPIIIEAAECGFLLLLEYIHSIGVNIHQASSTDSPSPLHAAIRTDELEVVRWLIKHGADCNIRYCDGQTPLFDAVTSRSLDIVRALVEVGGAAIDLLDNYGRTAIDWVNDIASDNKDPDQSLWTHEGEKWKEIVEYLEGRGCKKSSNVRQNNDA
jgi:hypothetical protein